MTNRVCYLMVRDIEGQEDETALEWGVDWGLAEGETLPTDHEQLSEAQFTVFQFMQTLKGVFEEADAEIIMGDVPSGLVVPKKVG